ncbi:MAG: flagellar hook-basal body complex protein [Planctomycetota bacterium]
MERSLYTGLSGLLTNQTYLDVIGDNIANVSTIAFKTNRLTFGDVLAETLSGAVAPSGTRGGVNPFQVGRGVRVHSIDPFMVQGVLTNTGRPLDLAIEGSGFFILDRSGETLYTRAGIFGLDMDGYLVDSASGLHVQGATGDIRIDVNAPMTPRETGAVTMSGNLPATITGPAAEVLSTESPWLEGTEASVVGTIEGPYDLDDDSGIPMALTVRVDGGSSRTVTFEFDAFEDPDAATAEEVAEVIQDSVSDAVVTVNAGRIEIRSRTAGEQSSIDIDDGQGGPAALLGLSTGLVRGEQFAATRASELSSLVMNREDYSNGDRINITGTDATGRTVSGIFTYGTDGTTVGEFVDFIDALYEDATLELNADGNLVLTANEEGEAFLTLEIKDASGSSGSTDFDEAPLVVSEEGAGPDTAISSIDVFDSQGQRHTLRLTFERQEGSIWTLTAVLPDADGTVVEGRVDGITFNEDGSLGPISDPQGSTITLDFGSAGRQVITLDLGTLGGFNGVTQFGDTTTVQAREQDGWPAGSLISIGVEENGLVQGYYTNGQKQELAQLVVATFTNPAGLKRGGDNLYTETANSGAAEIGSPASEGRGELRAGALEASNVELAQEFVRMIEAQRSYQANARVIRASDELLAEVMQL